MIKFADYFVICGLDFNSGLEPDRVSGDNLHVSPLERSYKCKILAHYPENVPKNPFDSSAVSMLSLPNGLKFRTQKHSVTHSPSFHSFVITREDGRRCYGFSLIFFEEVKNRDICSAVQTLQAMFLTEISSNLKTNIVQALQNQGPHSKSLPKHFKLSTTSPNGPSLTHYDIAKDKLFVSKSISIICKNLYVHAAKIFLENLYRCAPKRNFSTNCLSLESYVFNLLNEIQLPQPGKSLLIHLPPSDPHMPPTNCIIQCPSFPLELPNFDFQLRLIFTWLGVDVILQLFTCLLLENQILLRSTDCQRLMVVAEGITALLFPFSWPHVYVPILPASLEHFLDAPVPFFMGLHANNDNVRVASEATLCFVDIDKCKVQLPEEMAAFPHLEAFTAEIWAALDKHSIHIPNFENPKVWQQVNHDIMSRSLTLPVKPQNKRMLSIHDHLDYDRPPSPPGSARSEALQRIADIVRRTGVALDKKDTVRPGDSYLEDLRFNNTIREVFLNRFVHMFQTYENFVIVPNEQNKEDWLSNRDSVQNFDKASFLSDQPEQDRLFLSRFLESQMFATLIDNKILTFWGELDENLQIFDNRIKCLRQRFSGENLMRSLAYEPCTFSYETQKLIESRFENPDFESPTPREIMSVKPTVTTKYFPLLDKDVLNKVPIVNKGSIPRASATKKNLRLSRLTHSNDESKSNKSNQDSSPAVLAQANWTFVEKLLKDCKAKTKRMLLSKLGAEGVTLSCNNSFDVTGAVEESTLVTSLCDFLERVWSHGLQKKRGKSALWSHLLAYQEYHQNTTKINNQILPSTDFSKLSLRTVEWNSLSEDLKSLRAEKYNNSGDEVKNAKSELPPVIHSILIDISNVQGMTDVKTNVGKARAWVRLSLEKKQLSKHILTLLSDHTLLRSLYKRVAFLRCEEEREQFLYHLLSLNAVDYFCFTTTYPTTVIPYHVLIVPNKKGTMTSANVWIVLSGTLSETKRISIPKGALAFELNHNNVGVITTMRIGHDNSGLYAKWMIEYVLVRNGITGHTYKFPCGRWLGKGVDDGSLERLLVGQIVHDQEEIDEPTQNTNCSTSSLPRTKSPAPLRSVELKPSYIQHLLGDCVNRIVKWHYKRSSERNTTLTALLCGENGLVSCLELVFLLGFKSTRMFGRNHYLWDYFCRVKEQWEMDLLEENNSGRRGSSLERNHQELVAVMRCYCHLMDEIESGSKSIGKDGKFQLFICLSVREHLLHRMLVPLSNSKATQDMYEEQSFLQNRGLLTFLRQILLPLDDLDVVLENSVTHGISSHSN